MTTSGKQLATADGTVAGDCGERNYYSTTPAAITRILFTRMSLRSAAKTLNMSLELSLIQRSHRLASWRTWFHDARLDTLGRILVLRITTIWPLGRFPVRRRLIFHRRRSRSLRSHLTLLAAWSATGCL